MRINQKLNSSAIAAAFFAISLFSASLFAQETKTPEELLVRAEAFEKAGKIDLAIADLTEAIRLDPKYIAAYESRATIYINQGKSELAIPDLSKMIVLDPKASEIWFERGLAYYRLKKYEQAISDFTETIKLDPESPGAYMNRGNLYDELGKSNLAFADYKKAIALDPDNAENYYNRGVAYYRTGKYDLAIADMNRYIPKMEGGDNDAYLADGHQVRAEAYLAKGLAQKAIKDINIAIELAPEAARHYRVRALIYRKLKKISLAKADEKMAAELETKQLD